MKFASAILMIALSGFPNCESASVNSEDVSASFFLEDSLGVKTTLFHPGDRIVMRFVVDNHSGEDLHYSYTGVPVVFELRQADSIISTSIQGMVFAQVVVRARLSNNDGREVRWRGPQPPNATTPMILAPGQYQAYVYHGCFFDEFRLSQRPPITLTIAP